jgi:hypothetical protein
MLQIVFSTNGEGSHRWRNPRLQSRITVLHYIHTSRIGNIMLASFEGMCIRGSLNMTALTRSAMVELPSGRYALKIRNRLLLFESIFSSFLFSPPLLFLSLPAIHAHLFDSTTHNPGPCSRLIGKDHLLDHVRGCTLMILRYCKTRCQVIP